MAESAPRGDSPAGASEASAPEAGGGAPEPGPANEPKAREDATSDPAAGGSSDRSTPDPAELPGDAERSWLQSEIRGAVTESIGSLGSFGSRSSRIKIVAGKVHFHAPVAGGDISLGGAANGSAVLCAVSTRTVDTITRVHVLPKNYQELAGTLHRDGLLLLLAPRRWGSTTTAIRLLASLQAVHELRFGGLLSTLPVEELPEKCGFVLERLTAAQLAELRDRDLPALQDRLAGRKVRLVVIVDAGTRLPDQALQRQAHALVEPPAALALVTSHLTTLLPAPDQAEPFLAEHGLVDTLGDVDPDAFDAHQLVELAFDLAEAVQQRCTVEEAVARFQDRSRQDVAAWLDGTSAFDQKAALISLAVLHRMPYDAVSRAATLLEQAWRTEDSGTGTLPPRARRTRSLRLQAARARIVHEVRSTRYGTAELEIASFVDDRYPSRLLYHLWHEHDFDRDLILSWLRQVSGDVEGRVRIRAATALGFLAQYAFDTIRREVITPWAGSGNGDERELAAASLALPARHPETAGRTVGLVLDWAERKRGPLLITAVRALGASVGATLAGGPDEQLTTLADEAGPRLAIAIGDSVAELIAESDPTRQLALLRLLDGWSAEARTGRQIAGIFGFLEVAQGLWTPVSIPPEGVEHWPTLLWLATGPDRPPPAHPHPGEGGGPAAGGAHGPDTGGGVADPATGQALREVVARCWERALLAPGADNAVRNVLSTWAAAAERSPGLRQALVGLLVEAASTRRTAQLLAHHARSWRDRRALAPDLAQRLLDALHRGGSTS